MGIDIVEADTEELEKWNDHVEKSPDTSAFHRIEALRTQAAHSGTELHPLVGYKGQEPTGVFPVFERTKGPLTVAFSPPPPLWIQCLGPALLNTNGLKQRKRERRTTRFVEGCIEWVDENVGADLLRVTTDGNYDDLRPFKWNDADVSPAYTYVVDLSPELDDLIMEFSSDARKNIRNAEEIDHTVAVGDRDDALRIIEEVRQRYDNQGKSFNMPSEFIGDLYDALPDGRLRPYVCRADGEYLGGVLAVEDDDRIYRWQGGTKPDIDIDLAVNDVLDWGIMTDAKERDIGEYDLVGADDRRIASYKAKFAPSLETFYNVERGSWSVKALVDIYGRARTKGLL